MEPVPTLGVTKEPQHNAQTEALGFLVTPA